MQYSLVGQEINIPGTPDAGADHQVGSADPWYLVADGFVVCEEGDLSGGCDCPEGYVRVCVSTVHTSRVVARGEAPQSRTELPAIELQEGTTLFWETDLIVARTKPTRGPKAGAKRKKSEVKVKSEGARKAASRGAPSGGQQRDLGALEALKDVWMGTGTSKDVTSMPGLENVHRRQNPDARQPNKRSLLDKKPTT